jgi:hypothetical protein
MNEWERKKGGTNQEIKKKRKREKVQKKGKRVSKKISKAEITYEM